MNKCCATCRAYDAWTEEKGTCRLHPPIMYTDRRLEEPEWYWPPVHADEWCCDWQHKQGV